ncbi:DNA translocase FtsK [Starkeya koreensis]|uniref:DNA translocase FtsK n=1 Tax=Ancylobacter koreensis TaxID=266121 RepID=A0ABT0DNT9_9HYPH|nr:DNA translocase FtsK [Ancylobacter koreensis]MCK0208943.1 DNA translocase FtsK [Ancylobacter koreensis]
MRNPARPSDSNADKASETTDGAPRRIFSRANPQTTYAPPAPKKPAPATPAARSSVPKVARPASAPAAPGPQDVIPSWLQPFSMPPNTRFTRTPDYLLRQPPAAVPAEPEAPAATAAIEAAFAPPRPSQTPVLRVPPRKPPLGAVPKALIAAHARRALTAQPTPADLPVETTEAPPEPEFTPEPAPAPVEAHVPEPAPEPASAPARGFPTVAGWSLDDRLVAANDAARPEGFLASEEEDYRAAGYVFDEEADDSEEDAFEEDFEAYGEEDGAPAFDEAFEAEDEEDDEDFAFAAPQEETFASEAAAFPAPAPAAPVVTLSGFDSYSATPLDVSFSWPSFGMVPVSVEPARAPAPVIAAPAPAPVAAAPAPRPAPVAVPPAAPVAARPAPAPAPRPVREEAAEYELPPLELLTEPPQNEPDYELSEEFLDRNSVKLQQVLHDFGVRGEIIDANPGPVVTLYELEPAPGIKSSRVIGLSADIARSMSAISARVAVVEGRNVIGIELPNQRRETVWLREMLASHEFEAAKAKLGIGLGKTIGGEPVIVDLARMPHLLVAGTTGSGKSVAINTMILSLLYRHRPDQCRLIMIDPKMLELSVYEGIPHLLTPVVTDPKKAIVALKWAVREMEDRYRKMSRLGVRNIDGFNARMAEAAAKGEIITRTVQKGFDKETGEMLEEEEIMDLAPLPYIVIVVDEMADLMMVAGKDIEGAIQRLAQMARAAGIHLIMATQRPSVDVITGTIKANFPTRISFQVTSKIDSRTILGEMGAEQLLGQGDMLYMAGGGRISRVHGPFVSDQEVERVVEHLKCQARPEYLDEVTAEDEEEPAAEDGAVFDKSAMGSEDAGDLYDQAVAVVMRDKKASTSYIQRRLQIGYNRAASIMERMENEGIVGPANHAGKREILSSR